MCNRLALRPRSNSTKLIILWLAQPVDEVAPFGRRACFFYYFSLLLLLFFFLFFLSFISQLLCFLSSLPTLASPQHSLRRLSLLIAISFAYNNALHSYPTLFLFLLLAPSLKSFEINVQSFSFSRPFYPTSPFERILARRYRFRLCQMNISTFRT